MSSRQTVAEARVTGAPSTSTAVPVMLGATLATLKVTGPVAGAIIALGGVLFGLLVNGDRAERHRRRDLHARALAAVLAYGEMPFMIRRRRCEATEKSAERIRLSDHFSQVKAELSTCQVLLAADGDETLANAYDDLVEVARGAAGKEAHEAWKQPPISSDREMNMGNVFDKLAGFRDRIDTFSNDLAQATLPRRKRLRRRLRTKTRPPTSQR